MTEAHSSGNDFLFLDSPWMSGNNASLQLSICRPKERETGDDDDATKAYKHLLGKDTGSVVSCVFAWAGWVNTIIK